MAVYLRSPHSADQHRSMIMDTTDPTADTLWRWVAIGGSVVEGKGEGVKVRNQESVSPQGASLLIGRVVRTVEVRG